MWTNDIYKGDISGATLKIAGYTIKIQRHSIFEPDQWLFTCRELGIIHNPIGAPGASLDAVKMLVIRALLARLGGLVHALQVMTKTPE